MSIDTVTTETVGLPEFPMTRGCPYHPSAGYEELRREGPLARVRLYDGRVAWVVTGYEETRRLLVDPRLSSDRTRPDFPVPVPRTAAAKLTALVGMDPPEHDIQRRMLIPSFTVKRVNSLRPAIRRVVGEKIDALLADGRTTADLVPEFALPVPSTVICELLGVPYSDHDFFEQRTSRMVQATSTAQEAGEGCGTGQRRRACGAGTRRTAVFSTWSITSREGLSVRLVSSRASVLRRNGEPIT